MPKILSGLISAVPSNFQAENASLNNWIALSAEWIPEHGDNAQSSPGISMTYDALDGLNVHV